MKLLDKKELLREQPNEYDDIRAVMPEEIVVGVESSPEEFVEKEGLNVARSLLSYSADLTHGASHLDSIISENVELLGDDDIKALKEIVGELKAQSIKVQQIATTYDEAEVSSSARKALKKLLK